MNKLNMIESVLEAIRDDEKLSPEEKSARHDMIDECVKSYVTYHNEAVSQGQSLALQRFRMNFDEYAAYVARLHEQRKELHKNMIDHTIVLNQLCEDHGVDKPYTGPLDTSKGRDDPDTRFGVAAFGEELCRDLFKTTHEYGVPARAAQAYMDYSKRIATQPESLGAMQRMMARAQAQRDMDASAQREI